MTRNRAYRTLALLAVLAAFPAEPARAIEPILEHDFIAHARAITSLPYFVDTQNVTATIESDEPLDCFVPQATLWYRYTPASDSTIYLSIVDQFAAKVGVFSGTRAGDLTFVRCFSTFNYGEYGTLRLTAGTTYWFQLDSDVVLPPNRTLSLRMSIQETGSISGRVTSEAGAPLAGVAVTASAYRSYGRATTGPDGRYRIDGLAATPHTVQFSDSTNVYRGEYYDDAWWQDARPVPVVVGEETAGIDAALHRNGTMGGRVTDRDGAPIQDVCVSVSPSGAFARTNADGRYRLGLSPTAGAIVRFFDCRAIDRYRPQYFADALEVEDATPVVVADGIDTEGIDAGMDTLEVPANDEPETAEPLGSLPAVIATNTMLATVRPEETSECVTRPQGTVWYRLTTPRAGRYYVQTERMEFGGFLAVYPGDASSPPTVACRADGTYRPRVAFDADAGESYLIQAGGFRDYAPGGELRLTVDRAAPPSNATATTAAPIAPGETVKAVTFGATADRVVGTCQTMSRAVWYRMTLPEAADVSLRTTGSEHAVGLVVYDDSGAARAQTACATGSTTSYEPLKFHAAAGRTYLIAAGDGGGVGGRLTLGASATVSASNDRAADARPVTLPYAERVDIRAATLDAGEVTACGTPIRTIWYRVTTPTAATVSVLTAGSNVETSVAVFRDGPAPIPVACDRDSSSWEGRNAGLAFAAEAGASYLVQIGTPNSYGTTIEVAFAEEERPANDDRAAAEVAGEDTTMVARTFLATDEMQEPRVCGREPSGRSVWYSYTPQSSGTVVLDTFGSTFDTVLGVYLDDGNATPAAVACNDDAPSSRHSRVSIPVTSGTAYLVRVAGWALDAGIARLHIVRQ